MDARHSAGASQSSCYSHVLMGRCMSPDTDPPTPSDPRAELSFHLPTSAFTFWPFIAERSGSLGWLLRVVPQPFVG